MSTQGTTASGFENVAQVLDDVAGANGEAACSVGAYVHGRQVVDLRWGDWQEDSLAMVYSSTKGAATLCAQILVERGLLDVDAPVTDYWPEFGAHQKEQTLVRHVLSHTAGVITFPEYWNVIGRAYVDVGNWDGIVAGLAGSPASWPAGSRCRYHGFSFGHLVGELIRRIDDRSPGTFFAEEVAGPLGVELYIGAPDAVLGRVLDASRAQTTDQNSAEDFVAAATQLLGAAREHVRAGEVLTDAALPWSGLWLHPDVEVEEFLTTGFINERYYRQAALPAANGISTGPDLARMYALLANGGELDGVRLLSEATIEQFAHVEDPSATVSEDTASIYALGYHLIAPVFAVEGAGAGAFGHAGAGGALAFADPEHGVSFGLAKSRSVPSWDTAARVAEAVYAAL